MLLLRENCVLDVCFLWTTVELHDPCNLIEHSQHRKRSRPINRCKCSRWNTQASFKHLWFFSCMIISDTLFWILAFWETNGKLRIYWVFYSHCNHWNDGFSFERHKYNCIKMLEVLFLIVDICLLHFSIKNYFIHFIIIKRIQTAMMIVGFLLFSRKRPDQWMTFI